MTTTEMPLPVEITEFTLNDDISGCVDVTDKFEKSSTKKWIKLIKQNESISFAEYNHKDYFIKIADVLVDDEVHVNGKKQGLKKRNTLIKFVPTISKDAFEKKTEWIYILLINDRIVKIGGTRTGIKERTTSYLCGHHIKERGKSGDCSKTNGFIYNTLEFYLTLGCKVEMYGYELPRTVIMINVFGNVREIITQTYHAYESTIMEYYKKTYSRYPPLCDNCDPEYKD